MNKAIMIFILVFLAIIPYSMAYEVGNDNFKFIYDKITTDNYNTGIIYTPQCLIDCYLPVQAYYTGSKAPNSITLHTNNFERRILQQKNDTTFVFNGFLWFDGSKYIDLPSQITIYKDQNFSFALKGKRSADIGNKGTDIMLTLYGYDLPMSWFNTSWSYKTNFSVQQTGSSTIYDIPILLNGTNGWNTKALISAGKMNANCSDLRIVNSAENSLLNFTFNSYENTVTGCNGTNTLIWVKMDNITTSNTTIYAYYGNPAAPFGNATGSNTFKNAIGVWHMEETTGNITNVINGKPCTPQGSGIVYSSNGIIGSGIAAGGAGGFWCPGGDITDLTGTQMAIEFYGNISSASCLTSNFCDFVRRDGASGGKGYWFIHRGDDQDVELSVRTDGEKQSNGQEPPINTYQYYAGIYNGSMVRLIKNTTDLLGAVTTASITSSTSKLSFLMYAADGGTYGEYMIGAIDEIRIWSENKTNDWFKRSYQQNLCYVGAEESKPFTYVEVSLKAPENGSLITNNLSVNHIFMPHTNVSFSNCSLWTNKTGSWGLTQSNQTPITDNANNTISYNYTAYKKIIWNVYCYDIEGKYNYSAQNWTFTLNQSSVGGGLTPTQARQLELVYYLTLGGQTYENTNTSCEGNNLRVDDHKYLCVTDSDCLWINTSRLERCPYGCADDTSAIGGACKEPNYMLTIYIILGIAGLIIFLKYLSSR